MYVTLRECGSFSLALKKKKKNPGGERVKGKRNMNAHHSNYKVTSLAQIKYPETGKVIFSVQTP